MHQKNWKIYDRIRDEKKKPTAEPGVREKEGGRNVVTFLETVTHMHVQYTIHSMYIKKKCQIIHKFGYFFSSIIRNKKK